MKPQLTEIAVLLEVPSRRRDKVSHGRRIDNAAATLDGVAYSPHAHEKRSATPLPQVTRLELPGAIPEDVVRTVGPPAAPAESGPPHRFRRRPAILPGGNHFTMRNRDAVYQTLLCRLAADFRQEWVRR